MKWASGQAAYEAWAKTVEDDGKYEDGADLFGAVVSHEDQECMLFEGRNVASIYINSLAEQYPDAARELTECASLLKSASECVGKMHEARGGHGAEKTRESFRNKQTRREISAHIRQAAKYEKDACKILETIIGKL